MEIIATNALISINETFFVQLISFLVFLYILNRVMIRPLIGTMAQRKEFLADVKTDIEKAKSDLEGLDRELDRQRRKVLREAEAATHKLDREADGRSSELFEAARLQIAQLRQETEGRVKQQVKDARAKLIGEVDAVTTAIMEKVLNRRVSS
jgi:F-type H+-transporting ATPase subunit b